MEANKSLEQLSELQKQDASLLSSIGLSLVKSGEINKAKDPKSKVKKCITHIMLHMNSSA